MKLILIFTIWFTKFLTHALRFSGKGRGTALPGLIIEKYLNFLIPKILELSPYTILITGTNGKTSTRTILTKIFETSGKIVLQNRSGSNLIRGIISEILLQSSLTGKVKADIAVFEVEEATMPKLCRFIKPEQIIVTNLFRDQLDAYGEIDRTQKFIQEAIDLSDDALVILNGDDPRVSSLVVDSNQVFFGLEDKHRGDFSYEGNNTNEVEVHYKASDIKITKNLGTQFVVNYSNYKLSIPGVFHIYNALASIASTNELKISEKDISEGIKQAKPAFGRGEIIKYRNSELQFFLIKNPAGLDLSLDLLKNIDEKINLIFVLNDNTADGKDVSWIWDGQFEKLNKLQIKQIICSGTRTSDMLLRVKYAINGLERKSQNEFVSLAKNFQVTTVDLQELPNHLKEDKYFVLPTYTAMLNLRKLLTGNALNV